MIMSTHLFYVLICFSCIIIFAIIHRKSKNIRQVFGIISFVFFSYFLTYETGFLHISDFFRTALICFISLLAALFVSSVKYDKIAQEKYLKGPIVTICLICFIVISVFFVIGVPWFVTYFPLENADAIIFTMMQSKEGSYGLICSMINKNILSPLFSSLLPLFIAELVLSILVFKLKKTLEFSFFLKKVHLYAYKKIWPTINQLLLLTFIVCFILFVKTVSQLILPSINIARTYFAENEKTNSKLYIEDYVFPDSVKITFPEQKKNLIVILMESMETNFQEYTPELNALKNENISFFPGGQDVSMTGWTMGAQVSKLCAIPLGLPKGLENSSSINFYLPKAKCLMDVLSENGYQQIYVQGSDGTFASKRTFWQQHSVNKFNDFVYYKKENVVPIKRENNWGLSDYTLYSLMKKELFSLEKKDQPFALYMMTVDTHFPEGEKSKACESEIKNDDKTQFTGILRCASKQVNSFVEWAKTQPWYKNTVIVILGDHTWSTYTELLNLPKGSPLYWINIFINSSKKPEQNTRQFSSLDMFPTILEAIGASVDEHRLGLGTSLLSDKQTLLEKYGRKSLDSLLNKKSYQYDYFMNGGFFIREKE